MGSPIVILGAGPAGVCAVEAFRAHDRQTPLIMFSAEPYPPYSPPAMVDHFLTGSAAHLWRGVDWPERMGVDYRPGLAASRLDPVGRRLYVHPIEGPPDEMALDFDRLLIATGSRLYAPLPGAEPGTGGGPPVYNFKSLSAAEALVGRVREGKAGTAVIVGAGFIGMEIALLLRELGVQVTQVEMLGQVMPTMLDAETAAYALQAMRRQGVEVRLETRARAFVAGPPAGVELESGEFLPGDILVAATGVRPNLDFLTGSGLAHGWGLTVDDCLQTSAPGIYAAGDVVETSDRLTGETFVHAILPNAVEQGRLVGVNLLGFGLRYEGAERMNSLKHLGLPIMAVGLKQGDEVLRSRVNDGWRTLYLQNGRLVGFQLVGGLAAAGALRTLLNRGDDLRRIKDRLLSPSFGQGTLVGMALA